MIKGVITPVITVLNEDGRVDFKGNEEHINNLIEKGINGLLFLGSIGEFFCMTMEEKKEFVRFVVKKVNKRVPVFIGTGGTVVEEVIELTKYAELEGADAAVVISPYYFKLDDESLYRYFAEVAKSTDMPVILYNFPDRTTINLEPDLVLKLAKDYKNIVGIKDTVDNISHTRKLIQVVKSEIKEFAVYSGFDEYFIPNLMAGGDGLIGGLSNVAPKVFAELSNAFKEKDFKTVEIMQAKICILMKIYDVSQPFVSAIKAAVNTSGTQIIPAVKKPSEVVNSKQVDAIKNILKDADII